MFKYLICFLTISHSIIASQEIKDSYPFFRQYRTTFNLTFGSVSLYKSNQVLQSKDASKTEKDFARGLTLIGLLRVFDGAYFLFNESKPELLIKEGKLEETHSNYEQNLYAAKKFEYKLRKYRAAVIFLNGVGFYGLYNEDPERNKLSLYPALGMFVVSTYAFFGKGPSEKVYDKKYSLNWNINLFKVANKSDFIPFPELLIRF